MAAVVPGAQTALTCFYLAADRSRLRGCSLPGRHIVGLENLEKGIFKTSQKKTKTAFTFRSVNQDGRRWMPSDDRRTQRLTTTSGQFVHFVLVYQFFSHFFSNVFACNKRRLFSTRLILFRQMKKPHGGSLRRRNKWKTVDSADTHAQHFLGDSNAHYRRNEFLEGKSVSIQQTAGYLQRGIGHQVGACRNWQSTIQHFVFSPRHDIGTGTKNCQLAVHFSSRILLNLTEFSWIYFKTDGRHYLTGLLFCMFLSHRFLVSVSLRRKNENEWLTINQQPREKIREKLTHTTQNKDTDQGHT